MPSLVEKGGGLSYGPAPHSCKKTIATETEHIRTEIETLVQDKVPNEMTTVCQSQKEANSLKMPLIGPKQTTRIACWNVRTLYQLGKTKQLVNEMKRYSIDICGVSEVRWTGNGKLNLSTGETIIYAGCEEGPRSNPTIPEIPSP